MKSATASLINLALLAALQLQPAGAQVRASQTIEASSTDAVGALARTQLDDTERHIQQMWGLSNDEMRRAKILAQGPRANFSVERISPLEILGIHARSDAERRQYAERLARIFHADVERSIAWDREMQAAMARLYPNEPMVSYDGLPKVQSSVGAADMNNIPRTQIIEKSATPPASVRGAVRR
ncbi:integrating conjugative element protein [Alicycliphilus denitrificans]|uniref:integrating conjugative element protein n=1 Tax=Alicycliphilus denitrificans TaxID=179636 RepID=UPI00384BF512